MPWDIRTPNSHSTPSSFLQVQISVATGAIQAGRQAARVRKRHLHGIARPRQIACRTSPSHEVVLQEKGKRRVTGGAPTKLVPAATLEAEYRLGGTVENTSLLTMAAGHGMEQHLWRLWMVRYPGSARLLLSRSPMLPVEVQPRVLLIVDTWRVALFFLVRADAGL